MMCSQSASMIVHPHSSPDAAFADAAPAGLRVACVTGHTKHPHSNIYMESPVFTPDGARFIFQRMLPDPPTICMQNRRRTYWLCDIDDGCSLRQLTDEPEAIAPAVSPDGRFMYYFVNNRMPQRRTGVELRRVDLNSFERETVMQLDGALCGSPCDAPPSRLYSLASIRRDGRAVCTGAFLGDGVHTDTAEWGVIVCDLDAGQAHVALRGRNYINPHIQYSRSDDPRHMRDILVQENLEVICAPDGEIAHIGSGCLVHVVRDDGGDHRILPCGGDAEEVCHGHQEWRGAQPTVIVGVDRIEPDQPHIRPLIEATPMPHDPDDPTPPRLRIGAERCRTDITRDMDAPAFGHTTFDASGTRFVGDWRAPGAPADQTHMYIGTLSREPDAALQVRYLLHPRTSYGRDQITHPHPCLSPDGRRLLFNSDITGLPQVWLAEVLPDAPQADTTGAA
ncbi:MAG: TolB family protein [Phycisphaeraceae bacterium]